MLCGAGCWAAVKELNLSYYIGETLLLTIYTLSPKPQTLNPKLSSLTATQVVKLDGGSVRGSLPCKRALLNPGLGEE